MAGFAPEEVGPALAGRLAFHELHELARQHNTSLGFSATVCRALPVINIGRRDLVAARVTRLRGIFNSTSNFILGEMATGRAYADALAKAIDAFGKKSDVVDGMT